MKQSAETTKSQTSVHLVLRARWKALPIESLEGNLTTSPRSPRRARPTSSFLGQRLEGVSFVVVDGMLFGAITAGTFPGLRSGRRYLRRLGGSVARKGWPT